MRQNSPERKENYGFRFLLRKVFSRAFLHSTSRNAPYPSLSSLRVGLQGLKVSVFELEVMRPVWQEHFSRESYEFERG
jgi:hypothetical protein